ncbi:uncharacterized protein L201_004649 [Kwoniella dendrophila CBS 6074]|uniref:Pentacotripeptide-repeat region of PRORP domain-containing protein n=1 Tax=Kwoniella dendrophila CBS 6074 TaxID=1295534 RepID=A0AAX4JXZ1_9TREE
MPPSHLHLAARSRVLTSHPSTATVSHVLSLVQNGYLDKASRIAVSQIRGYSRVAGSSIGGAKTSSASLERRSMIQRQNFRTYSASAAQPIDFIHDHEEYQPHSGPSSSASTSTFHQFATPSHSRSSKYKASPSHQSLNKGLTKDQKFFRAQDYPDDWSLLPDRFYERLYNGAFQSASHFIHDFESEHFESRQLGSIGNLLGVFSLFKRTAEYEDWLWLSEKLDRLSQVTSNIQVRQRGSTSLASSIRAYASAEIGEFEKAKEVLDQMSKSDYPSFSLPTTHSIASLTCIKLGDWELANKKMAGAIDRGVQRITSDEDNRVSQECDYPSFDFDLLKEYENSVLNNSRNDDLVELVRSASYTSRKFMINTTQHPRPFSRNLTNLLLNSLLRIGSPVEWWLDEFNRNSNGPTRTLGVFLFIALTRDRTKLREAVTLLDIFIANGTSVPTSAAIKLCSLISKESTKDAWELYQRVCQAFPNFTHQALSQAMRLAGESGWVEEEKRLWVQLSSNYKPSWKDRIRTAGFYATRGRVADTIATLETRVGKDFESNPHALEILFTAYINGNNAQGAETLLKQINKLEPRIYPYNSLLQLYADQNNVEAAVRLFDELSNSTLSPDIRSYTSLISLFAQRRDPTNADNVFQAMIDAGIQPDAIAHAAVMNAEVQTGDWLAAMRRYNTLPEEFKYDQSISSSILKALVLLSAPLEHCMSVFRRIKKPNRHTWSLIIQNASDAGEMEAARELYEEMDDAANANQGPSPDAYAFSILLHGYMRLGDGSSARSVYDEMLSREILPSSVTYGMIVKSFAEARGERSLEQAHDFAINVAKQAKAGNIADKRHEKAMINQNIFSPLVVAHGRNQNLEMAQSYFDMTQDGNTNGEQQRESVHMYTQLMDVYRRSSNLEQVMENWKKAFQLACDTTSFRKPSSSDQNENESEFVKVPSRSNDNILCIPLSIALDILSIKGKYKQVKKIWNDVQDAGFGFDSGNYNHLSVALARTGDVEGAFMVADQILLKRYEEIKYRKNESMRESQSFRKLNLENDEVHETTSSSNIVSNSPEDIGEEISSFEILDKPVEPMFGPPNRRHVFHGRSPFTSEAKDSNSQNNSNELELKLLSNWRPSDILWKPSLLTISVLDIAYSQLEDAKSRRAWLPLAISGDDNEHDQSDNNDDEVIERKKRTYGIVLPLFGNVPVRNHFTGQPHRKGPTELLKSINRRYSKLVGLIMFHRKKRMSRKIRDRQGR